MTRRHRPPPLPHRARRRTASPARRQIGERAAVLASLILLSLPLAAQQGATFEAEYSLSTSAETPLLELSYELPALAEADSTPLLRIFGDGRFVVHRAFYMKDAGDWVGQLDRQQLENLFGDVVSAGLLDVDYGRLAAELNERRSLAAKRIGDGAGAGELRTVSERETTIIRVRLERYKPRGILGVSGEPLEKVLHISNLPFELSQNTDHSTLRSLSALSSRLRALTERPDLRRLDPDDGSAPLR